MPQIFQKLPDCTDNDPRLRKLNHVAAAGGHNMQTVCRKGGQVFLSFLPFGINLIAGHRIIPTTAHDHQRRIPEAAESMKTSFFGRHRLVRGHLVCDGEMAGAAKIQRHLFTTRVIRNAFKWVEAIGK